MLALAMKQNGIVGVKHAPEAAPRALEPPAKRRRLSPQAREAEIIAEAIRYFAEHGFDGGTIELAKRLGVTQPLLFKYFLSKNALIDRVYAEVFPGHWRPEWDVLLADTGIYVEDRIVRFYIGYFEDVLTYEYVRLFLFGALRRLEQNVRFNAELERRVHLPIATALRNAAGLPPPAGEDEVLDEVFMERARALHATIYQLALRRWVYLPPLEADFPALIRTKVRDFLHGAIAAHTTGSRGAKSGTRVLPAPARTRSKVRDAR